MSDPHIGSPAGLRLDNLPPLPQSHVIESLAPRLWQDDDVIAIWLGGSLAAGTGDRYSDIDLRVAVAQDALAGWETPDFQALFDGPPLAHHFLRFGVGSFLHHLIVPGGDILDLLVQSAETPPGNEPVLALGCHNDAFAEQLAANNQPPSPTGVPATADAVRELIVSFWVNSHKHRKVLHRNLDLMFPAASYANWQMLMRLWYIATTGHDTEPRHFSGIHGLTELVRAVEAEFGSEPLALCGAPTRTRTEICDAIERYQEVVAQLGRRLAERFGFAYPTALEETVRRDWRAFRAAVG